MLKGDGNFIKDAIRPNLVQTLERKSSDSSWVGLSPILHKEPIRLSLLKMGLSLADFCGNRSWFRIRC